MARKAIQKNKKKPLIKRVLAWRGFEEDQPLMDTARSWGQIHWYSSWHDAAAWLGNYSYDAIVLPQECIEDGIVDKLVSCYGYDSIIVIYGPSREDKNAATTRRLSGEGYTVLLLDDISCLACDNGAMIWEKHGRHTGNK